MESGYTEPKKSLTVNNESLSADDIINAVEKACFKAELLS
jgi:hypothetical protein